MPSKGLGPKKPQIARLVALSLAAILAAAIAGWSLLWFAASRKTDALLTAWMAHEAEAGRSWDCPERHIGGYPFDIEISCARLLFQGALPDATFTGSLGGFHAIATVFQPGRVIARMDSPFVGKTSDGALDFTLRWDNLNLEFEGKPEAPTRLSLGVERIALQGVIDGWDARGHAEGLQAALTPIQGRADAAIDFQINLNNASAPAIDNLLALKAPFSVALSGIMTQASFSNAGKLQDRIEQWRQAGGQIDLRAARLTSGEAKLDARGAVDLDYAHRIHGKLDAAITGFNPVLSRLGVDPRLLAAGSLLTGLLGNSTSNGAKDSGAVRLPLKIADGWLSVGPIRTPVRLSPLY
ncbi:MAG: DUF2125 domain-containing protein [Methylocella sp.]